MKESKTLVKNSSLLFISQFLSRLFGFLFITYFARKFGTETLGDFGLITTFFMYFVTMVEFGLNPLLIREIARDETKIKHYFFNVLIIRSLFSILSLIIIIPILGLLNYSSEFRLLTIIYFINILFQPLLSTLSAVFWGINKYEYPTISIIITSFIGTAVNFIVLFLGYGLKEIILVSIPVNLVPMTILIGFLIKLRIKIKFNFNLNVLFNTIKKGVVFFLIAIFFIIYIRTDLVILSRISSQENVGLYNAAFRIFMIFLIFINIVSHASFPTMSRLYKENFDKFDRLFYSLLRLYMCSALPMAIFFSLFSKQILPFIFGKDFTEAYLAMIPLSWTFLIMALNTPIALALNTTKFEKVSMYTAIIGAILNIGLDFLFIPEHGILGAGVATVIPRIVNTIIISIVFIKYFFKIDLKRIWKILIINIILGSGLYFLTEINFLFVLGGYILGYIIMVFIFKVIEKEELEFIRELIRTWKGNIFKNRITV